MVMLLISKTQFTKQSSFIAINKLFSPRYHGQSKSMKKNIGNYIGSIVHNNEDAIMNGWYSSIADYIIHNAENGAGWYEYFDDSEPEDNLGEPTQE